MSSAGRYRQHIDADIAHLLALLDGRDAMTRRTIAPGLEVIAPARPLKGLRAAIGLLRECKDRIRDFTRYAREDGHSWEAIGEALDRHADPYTGVTVAEAAFAFAASDLGRGLSFAWPCPSCGQMVIDYGPGAGHPEDAERGHGQGCARFAEAARAHEEDYRPVVAGEVITEPAAIGPAPAWRPVVKCLNCGRPVHQVRKSDPCLSATHPRGRTTATGWDHWGFWQGVRCPGRLTGAEPGGEFTEDEYLAWVAVIEAAR